MNIKFRDNIVRLVLVLTICYISGCGTLKNIAMEIKKNTRYEADLRILEKGYDVFSKGEMTKASEIFEKLNQQNVSESIRNEALYGLACIRLSLSRNCEDFNEAFTLWHNWSKGNSKKKISRSDPRMLEPLLEKVSSNGFFIINSEDEDTEDESYDQDQSQETQGNSEQNKADNVHDNKQTQDKEIKKKSLFKRSNQPCISQADVIECKNQNVSYRKLVQSKEKEIHTIKNELLKTKKDIQVLKNQISELETIHQNIQEKKKGIENP